MLQGEHLSSNSSFQILNYSYSIHAKHELQQSLETNQTKEISLQANKGQLQEN